MIAPGPAASAPRPAWVPQSLFPFQSRFLDVDGCRVHYIDEGRGPVLLFLHGNPTWSFLYREIVHGLSDRFRCIALDYPGFGLSTAPAGYDFKPAGHSAVVERFIEALDLRDITLMVQDWGGPIGFGAAIRHPERFRAFVIGNTWAWPVSGERHFRLFSRIVGGAVGRLLILNYNAFVNVGLRIGVNRRKLPRAVMNAYRAPFPDARSRIPTAVFPREILDSRDFLAAVEAGLPRLSHMPALIVWGDADFAFRAIERRRFEAVFPRHRTVILPGAGHFIQEDAPGEIATAIRSWWEHQINSRG